MEHLPECYWPELPERAICICDRLRAREQRVLGAEQGVVSKEAARFIREYAERTHQTHDIRVGCPRCDLTAALLACAIELESANADTRANDGERRQGNDFRNDGYEENQ